MTGLMPHGIEINPMWLLIWNGLNDFSQQVTCRKVF